MVKRPFVIFSIAFVAGILSVIYGCCMWVLLVAALFVTVIFFRKRELFVIALVSFFFMSSGVTRMAVADYVRDETVRKFDGSLMEVSFTVTEFSENGKAVSKFSYDGKSYYAYLSVKNIQFLKPGDIVKGKVSFSSPYSSKVSLSGFSSYLAGRNVFLYAKCTDGNVTGQSSNVIYLVRRYINSVGEKFFDGDVRSLFNAMILGDKHLLTEDISGKLQKAGLNHIAVVSGMHLSIIIAVQAAVLGRLFGKRRIGHIFSVIFALFITLVTGAGASVVRAFIMCVIYKLSQLLYRENDSVTSLALTVFLMALYNPFILFNAGFILSVASVSGILLYYNRVQEITGKFLKGYIRDAASVTISAQLVVTLPVICYFGIVTPYTLLANLLVSVFASMLVICGMLFCVLSEIPVIAGICAFIVKFLADAVLVVCDGISLLPGALLKTGNPSAVLVIVWVFFLIVLMMKKPDRKKLIKTASLFIAVFSVAVAGKAYRESKIRMTFVPYGSKCMTTMFFPDGDSILIDCHNYEDAKEIKDRENKESYTCVVLSGKYENEITELAEESSVKIVIASSEMFSDVQREELSEKLKASGTNVVFLDGKESYYCKNAYIRFIPVGGGSNRKVIPEIEYMGKRFATLQSFSVRETEKLIENETFIDCDFLKVPFLYPKDAESVSLLSDGKVLTNEKSISIN